MEFVSPDEFAGRKNVCDERFSRDKDLLEKLTAAVEQLSRTESSINQLLLAQIDANNDHETRLRTLESRRGDWFDKISGFLLGAIISGLIAFILTSMGVGA